MKRILILAIVCLIALTACGNKVEIEDIAKGFKDAGLNVNNEKEMTREDYGAAPMKAENGIIFGVEKGQDGQYKNGRLLEFKDEKDLDQTKEYYDKLGKESAILYSHTYKTEDGKYLLQMNGEIDDSTFDKYKDTMIKVLNGEKVEKLAINEKSKEVSNNTEEFQSSNVVDSSVSESLADSNPQQINNTENTQQNQQEESGQQITKQQTPVNNSSQPNSEQLPTNGIGGHPSLYDPSIPPPSEDNLKTDENGDVYYDATNE
ncbi:hypothetical protein [Staphylococcus chromogenes]|uniref:hypothetical protein n=1 Tax=Staphylococcus chromogenes TaxID=46126 RepID=UPI001F5481A9|nr:hypothetical protein [Staphylococcus chromogenes]